MRCQISLHRSIALQLKKEGEKLFRKGFEIFIRKLPVYLAGILFLAMLLNCGQYINIKINGNTSALSSMPENDKRIVLRSSTSQITSESKDLITPVFMGFKVGKHYSAALFSEQARNKLKNISNSYQVKLFSGTSELVEFANYTEKQTFFDNLENLSSYIVLCYYNDIPASAVLPSLAKEYERKNTNFLFSLNRLFIYPDENGNIEAAAVSSKDEVNILTPLEQVPFNSSELEAYNDSEEFTSFSYRQNTHSIPLFDKSVNVNLYSVSPSFDLEYYKKLDNKNNRLLDIFSINNSLVTSFMTRDDTVLNFVDSSNELNMNQDGLITYKSYEDGIYLSEFLGYYPEFEDGFTFSDKIASVKNLISLLGNDVIGQSAILGITGLDYEFTENILSVKLKYFCNGIAVTEKDADAVINIKDNYLTSASIYALKCDKAQEVKTLIPQSFYDGILTSDQTVISCIAMLKTTDVQNLYEPVWVHNISDK